eukprot:Awhi_evm1s13684
MFTKNFKKGSKKEDMFNKHSSSSIIGVGKDVDDFEDWPLSGSVETKNYKKVQLRKQKSNKKNVKSIKITAEGLMYSYTGRNNRGKPFDKVKLSYDRSNLNHLTIHIDDSKLTNAYVTLVLPIEYILHGRGIPQFKGKVYSTQRLCKNNGKNAGFTSDSIPLSCGFKSNTDSHSFRMSRHCAKNSVFTFQVSNTEITDFYCIFEIDTSMLSKLMLPHTLAKALGKETFSSAYKTEIEKI